MRPLLLLLALAAAGPAAAPLEAKTLSPRDRLAFPWLRAPAPEGTKLHVVEGRPETGEPARMAVSLDALAGRIGPEKVWFLDWDGDGSCLAPHRDLIVAPRTGELQPVAPFVVLGGRAFALEVDGEAGTIRAESAPEAADREVFPRFPAVAAGLARLNAVRASLNLPPVALSPAASRAAMLHLRYCERNEYGHREEAERPGYTEEGMRAGLSAIGYHGPGDVTAVVDGHLGSLLHRLELLDPRMTEVGIAADADQVWIHTESGTKRPWTDRSPVIFPAGEWASGAYALDNPDPRPSGTKDLSGIPVTAAFYVAGIRNADLSLRFRGRDVPAWRNGPAGRELATNHAEVHAVLMPKSPLRPGAYAIGLAWEDGGEPRRREEPLLIR